MPAVRRIGLSLGADICWPICYEDLLHRLDLNIPFDGETLRFEVDRVEIEPFSLRKPVHYDVVIDRLTHWLHSSREWIKKAILMDGLYVFNNPWSVQAMEKHTSYCAMMRLGFHIPNTWLLPPKEYDRSPDLQQTLESYARLFDLGQVGEELGYPMYMKPYDGGGWVGVNRVGNEEELRERYDDSGKFVMHLQRGIDPFDRFVRCVGMGPQIRAVDYDPSAPLHDRYRPGEDFLSDADAEHLRQLTKTINAFFCWDFNSCEALHRDQIWHPIDFANPCPDSQVTSLHYHFPWLIKANLRWSLFCAATRRPMRMNADWAPYFAIADEGGSFEENLPRYAALADAHFETERFEKFCEQHLGHLDELADEYFGTDAAHQAIRKKVVVLYPENEHDEFTELFWQRIQDWRETDRSHRAQGKSA